MSQIIYSKVEQEGFKGERADLEISVQRPTGNCIFSAVGAGSDKRDAQIALHNVLQDIYEDIGNKIIELREQL